MMLVVVEFERLARHVRRKRVIGVRKVGQRECHRCAPQCELWAGFAGETGLEPEKFLYLGLSQGPGPRGERVRILAVLSARVLPAGHKCRRTTGRITLACIEAVVTISTQIG